MSDPKRPDPKDFKTVGAYAEALVEFLVAEKFKAIEARVAHVEKYLEGPLL